LDLRKSNGNQMGGRHSVLQRSLEIQSYESGKQRCQEKGSGQRHARKLVDKLLAMQVIPHAINKVILL